MRPTTEKQRHVLALARLELVVCFILDYFRLAAHATEIGVASAVDGVERPGVKREGIDKRNIGGVAKSDGKVKELQPAL